jgi:hypothetical protein
MTEASRRSRLRSRVGRVGGVSAALMASSALVVLKVPATVRPMARVSLSKLSTNHCCPSQMASTFAGTVASEVNDRRGRATGLENKTIRKHWDGGSRHSYVN